MLCSSTNTSTANWAITISRNKQFSHHGEMRQYHRLRDVAARISRIKHHLQWLDNDMPGFFLPHANVAEPILPGVVHGTCVRVCRASALQSFCLLISYLPIYFLNVLSDGNAAGCSSEVLTRQMDLKGEVSPCQRQDFNSKLRDPVSFIIHGKRCEHRRRLTVLPIQHKGFHALLKGTRFFLRRWNMFLFNVFLKDSNWQLYSHKAFILPVSCCLLGRPASSQVNYQEVLETMWLLRRQEGILRCWNDEKESLSLSHVHLRGSNVNAWCGESHLQSDGLPIMSLGLPRFTSKLIYTWSVHFQIGSVRPLCWTTTQCHLARCCRGQWNMQTLYFYHFPHDCCHKMGTFCSFYNCALSRIGFGPTQRH